MVESQNFVEKLIKLYGLKFVFNYIYIYIYVYPFQNIFLRCPTPRLHCFLSFH
jgi:hypothetical protein